MYLQITTKCNMKCDHCGYSCGKNGKHMDYSMFIQANLFAMKFDNEMITIGGGEPTLHPRFFDILEKCLDNYKQVWMATNGSQTKKMLRLANIIHGEDFPDDWDPDSDEEPGGIFQDGKLTVALSLDYFHDPIDSRIVDIWKNNANRNGQHRSTHFEIRDVSLSKYGPVAEGRAKKTGVGRSDDCICSDLMIKPDGTIRLCGCQKAPVIGNVNSGIEERWKKVLFEDEDYNDNRCFKKINGKIIK